MSTCCDLAGGTENPDAYTIRRSNFRTDFVARRARRRRRHHQHGDSHQRRWLRWFRRRWRQWGGDEEPEQSEARPADVRARRWRRRLRLVVDRRVSRQRNLVAGSHWSLRWLVRRRQFYTCTSPLGTAEPLGLSSNQYASTISVARIFQLLLFG